MKKRIGIDLEGTLIDNARSAELQELVKSSDADWYLVTAYHDPIAVEGDRSRRNDIGPRNGFY